MKVGLPCSVMASSWMPTSMCAVADAAGANQICMLAVSARYKPEAGEPAGFVHFENLQRACLAARREIGEGPAIAV